MGSDRDVNLSKRKTMKPMTSYFPQKPQALYFKYISIKFYP